MNNYKISFYQQLAGIESKLSNQLDYFQMYIKNHIRFINCLNKCSLVIDQEFNEVNQIETTCLKKNICPISLRLSEDKTLSNPSDVIDKYLENLYTMADEFYENHHIMGIYGLFFESKPHFTQKYPSIIDGF